MMFAFRTAALVLATDLLAPVAALATAPKFDAQTCTELRLEHLKSVELGLYKDIQRGPEWAKANLSPERLRDLQLFIQLDEQVKFGCRDVKLTLDAERAGEAARRLELNPNLDPAALAAPDAASDDDPEAGAVAPGGQTANELAPNELAPNELAPTVTAPTTQAPTPQSDGAVADPKPKPKAKLRQQPAQKSEAAKTPPNDAYAQPSGTGSALQPPPGSIPATP